METARALQAARFAGTRMLANADRGPAEVRDHCRLDDAGKSLLKAAMQQRPGGTRMSARGLRGFRGNPSHPEAGADDCRPLRGMALGHFRYMVRVEQELDEKRHHARSSLRLHVGIDGFIPAGNDDQTISL